MQRNISTPIQTKLYISLRKRQDDVTDYKKLVLMISEQSWIYELKRKIEREFSELFPHEPPFVVAKLEDDEGFAVSNQSQVKDVCVTGDRLVA